ncbi:AGAP005475-PA-like protein [Anopheles sinensis]|uniref:AGAP005475-PA-like protein n=1 Tax=Anopheles sinensis TaxID=74873 RepID=A0A084WCD1_ANOSI|nr:AGAP005475-PA-like protein [Anopheles sinensis]
MENSCMESEEVKFELTVVNDETQDPLEKENTIDTYANYNPSIRQVCSWINDGTTGIMSVEEIEIEEIKIESTDNSDPSCLPSCEQKSQLVTENTHESSQTESSSPGTTSHNDRQYRRIRCNFCSLLFFSKKTLANHQKKCQLVSEIINAPKAVPVRETKDILEDLQKRLPQFTVAVTGNEAVGTNSRADGGFPVPHERIPAFTVPIDVTVTIKPEIEALPNSLMPDCASSAMSTNSSTDGQNQTVSRQGLPPEIAAHLERIENKLAQLRKENCQLREALAVSMELPMEEYNELNVIDFERLDTEKQMVEFNEKLGEDATFADNMVTLLKLKGAKSNPKSRIVLSLDFLFSRQLFAKCSWTGASRTAPKLPFSEFKNILTLLQRVSGTSVDYVENCVRSRLCHSHSRLHGISGRKAYCKLDRSSDNTRCISPFADHNDSNDFNFEQLDTEKQMEEFEEKLGKDTAFADTMVALLKMKAAHWNPQDRIVLSLDLLFSRQLFASCSWTGAGRPGPKIPLVEFKNILSLLKRVSTLSGISVEKCLRSRLQHSISRLRGLPGRKPYCK